MDFFEICVGEEKRGKPVEVYPDFTVGRSKDLMVRGQAFYAIWDEEQGFWLTDEYEVVRLVDEALNAYAIKLTADGIACKVRLLRSSTSKGWYQFRTFMKNISDNSTQLDAKVAFANTRIKKSDYCSRRLDYSLEAGPHPAYDELIGTLYSAEEKAKLEWAIGAVIAGDSKNIQKFLALYGKAGSGKGTVLDLIKKLFPGYHTTFEAKSLVSGSNLFATEAFKMNPLIAIDPDALMDRIEDNTKFNMITSHDDLLLNEKFKPQYTTKINSFVFVGTNNPIKITDAKSGITRRLIDVRPSGKLVDVERYSILMTQIDFELGAIAAHCLETYRSMGKNYYANYRAIGMMLETDPFFNFVEFHYDIFKKQEYTTLKQAWSMYKEYCDESKQKYPYVMHKFREELKNYFAIFEPRVVVDNATLSSVYRDFTAQPFKTHTPEDTKTFSLVLDEIESLFDAEYADIPAQYGTSHETPSKYWTHDERLIGGVLQAPKPTQVVDTVLKVIDTSRLHFVKVPVNHIVIDFDLRDKSGKKSLLENLRASSAWPPTYAELSKSGEGVHLHYLYDGNTEDLANEYSPGIEIKVFHGGASLRRRLTKCNNVPVATINGGLPFKEKTKVHDVHTLKSEKALRALIARNLRKEIHPGTKPSIDFIEQILIDANAEGMVYDLTDLEQRLMAFANNSTNQALTCIKTVLRMKLKSDASEAQTAPEPILEDAPLVIFDVEVFRNLLVVCWGYENVDGSDTVVRMINPTPQEVEAIFKFRLIGFNNRNYDNHILWARFMGYNNQQLYELSKKILAKERGAMFGEAYNLSYADILDFSSVKQSLKKFQIQLRIKHMELGLNWDEDVPEELFVKVAEYCANDVDTTRQVLKSRRQDFVARKIMAALSGLPVNSTSRSHSTKIMFGDDRTPQDHFNYTDLTKEFPGYVFDPYNKLEKSTYRDTAVGEGGYVYAQPGMYQNVAVLDIASMHPTSIVQLDLFGKYTERFANLLAARLFIKHGDLASAVALIPELDGIVEDTPEALADLAVALKLMINSIYGYTSATFPNAFRDVRNIDNIVAKRGSLFMVDLMLAVMDRGFQVVHIKTDSIKIPNATQEIIDFVREFGQTYGYDFEHEDTYHNFCLVNDAVYIADVAEKVTEKKTIPRHWKAVGAQFAHPVVFKALFTNDMISFDDLCETKEVRDPTAIYLDFNESAANPTNPYSGMHFVGKTGSFVPVNEWIGGAKMVRVKDDVPHAVSGTKNYLWLEADMIRTMNLDVVDRMTFRDLTWEVEGSGSIIDIVDMRYYSNLVNDAIATIEKFGSFEGFVMADSERLNWDQADTQFKDWVQNDA